MEVPHSWLWISVQCSEIFPTIYKADTLPELLVAVYDIVEIDELISKSHREYSDVDKVCCELEVMNDTCVFEKHEEKIIYAKKFLELLRMVYTSNEADSLMTHMRGGCDSIQICIVPRYGPYTIYGGCETLSVQYA